MISFILLTLSTSYIFYKIDAHNIIFNHIRKKHKSWKKINKLASSNHDSTFDIYRISFEMLYQALKQSFVQYLNDSVKKLDKNTYEVTYVLNGQLYKMLVTPTKGPTPVFQIRNEKEEDMMDIVLPYYGPAYDLHSSCIITPSFFNCSRLVIEMSDGTEKIFNENECINYSQILKNGTPVN